MLSHTATTCSLPPSGQGLELQPVKMIKSLQSLKIIQDNIWRTLTYGVVSEDTCSITGSSQSRKEPQLPLERAGEREEEREREGGGREGFTAAGIFFSPLFQFARRMWGAEEVWITHFFITPLFILFPNSFLIHLEEAKQSSRRRRQQRRRSRQIMTAGQVAE